MTILFRFLLLLTLALVATPAPAQPEPSNLTARALTTAGMLDLRMQPEGTMEDYRIAATMLEIALEVTPDDPLIWRRLIEAYRAAGDERGVMDASLELWKIDPSDSVAELRLLSWNASKKQTVEERLATYERYLGARGAQDIPNPAVRSRLALDAALLAREQGNEKEFVRLLTMATSLDSSNKEAAALAASFYQSRQSDPVANLELAINLLRADPVDPNLHFAVAGELARHGAMEEAQRFHTNARRLIATDGITGDAGIETETYVLRWHNSGAEAILREFEEYLIVQREVARNRVERMTAEGLSTEDIQKPEDIRLPLHLERIRILAAAAQDDDVRLTRALRDLNDTVIPGLEEISNRLRTPIVQEDAQLRQSLLQQAGSVATELLVARLIAGVTDPAAMQENMQFRGLLGDSGNPQLRVIDGLIALRQGNLDDALGQLEELAQDSTLSAVAYGLALEEAGRDEEAAENFERTALFSPTTPIGAYARDKYERLSGEELVYSDSTQAMQGVARAVPRWFDLVAGNPGHMMSMTLTLEEQRIDPYEQPVVQLTLRNVSPIALAVGSDRPINSRLMISPAMRIGTESIQTALSPEITDLHTRLRLAPGEAMSVRIWPDPGFSGFLADLKSAHTVRARWHMLQGFVMGDRQLYVAGPMCLSGETPLLTRTPDVKARQGMDELTEEVRVQDESKLILLLPTLRAVLVDPDRPTGQPSAEEARELASALATRYPNLSKEGRLAVIALMPHARMNEHMQALDDAILAETDPAVLAAAIITRVNRAGHPALVRAKASDDTRLARVAEILEARLSAESPAGYAFFPPIGSHRPPPPEHPEATER